MKAIILKKGREKLFQRRHHWIFSGAIHSYPDGYEDGELISIKSFDGQLLGWGFFNRGCSLAGRIVSFGTEDVYVALKNSLNNALSLRRDLLNTTHTTACRLVNGEGDGLPGLIIDQYGPYLVVQTGTLGMRKLLPFLCEELKTRLSILGIYDKSVSSALKAEKIEPQEKILWGEIPNQVTVREEGIQFNVLLKNGQKTGFFLDQREMRSWVCRLAKNKSVLNGFCYTGGFTLAALKGGARQVDSVDVSEQAIALCQENVSLNGYSNHTCNYYTEDMFDFLSRCAGDYDFVILDPPAFAKKKKDIPAAIKAYKRLFGLAMRSMPSHSFLLLSSCSYYITESAFEKMVSDVALSLKRIPRIIGAHRNAVDHPVNPYHPESKYLKSLLLAL